MSYFRARKSDAFSENNGILSLVTLYISTFSTTVVHLLMARFTSLPCILYALTLRSSLERVEAVEETPGPYPDDGDFPENATRAGKNGKASQGHRKTLQVHNKYRIHRVRVGSILGLTHTL